MTWNLNADLPWKLLGQDKRYKFATAETNFPSNFEKKKHFHQKFGHALWFSWWSLLFPKMAADEFVVQKFSEKQSNINSSNEFWQKNDNFFPPWCFHEFAAC